jgi:two-component system sensor histidine kinase FlrB
VRDAAVRWRCDSVEGQLLCNRDTLVGALLNLIENAVQASAGRSRIKIHAYNRGNTLRLCISDNGSGIDAAALTRIGEPFFTTKTTGTGLGLAVVTAVARAHQGQVQFRSRPGRGTCAIVSLPLIPAVGALGSYS